MYIDMLRGILYVVVNIAYVFPVCCIVHNTNQLIHCQYNFEFCKNNYNNCKNNYINKMTKIDQGQIGKKMSQKISMTKH